MSVELGSTPGRDDTASRNASPPVDVPRRGRNFLTQVGQYGVIGAFALTVVIFSLLKPDQFVSLDNLRIILIQAAPLAVLALGLTIVLVMNDFDLSFGPLASLASAIAVISMAQSGLAWPISLVLAVVACMLIGLTSGFFIAFAGAPSFIVTLAMGTAVTGGEYLLTGQRSVYAGISPAYLEISRAEVLGINLDVIIALVVLLAVYLLLHQSESGRRMYAVGANPEAARLAGIRLQRLRVAGFVMVATAAAIAGILASSRSAAYTPSIATGFLLPAFAGAFLGTSFSRRGAFTALGTSVGILFLSVIQNGLILLGIASAWVNIVQGAILIAAVLVSRLGSRP
jgi:ribose transport system permease protein